MAPRKVKMIVEKTRTGFSAYSDKLPIATTSRNIPELLSNAKEAVSLYFEEISNSVPEVIFELDFREFFSYYRVINAKVLGEKIGMNQALISQYVQGKRKPSPKQTKKILDGIQTIGKELSEISLI